MVKSQPVLHSVRNVGIGYLPANSKPDSAQSKGKTDEFPAVKYFSALLHEDWVFLNDIFFVAAWVFFWEDS